MRAMRALLADRDAARRWYEAYVAALGPLAVIDTADGGTQAWVHRRTAPGSPEVLPWVTVAASLVGRLGHVWPAGGMDASGVPQPEPPKPGFQLDIFHGKQKLGLVYDADGQLMEGFIGDRTPGGLVGLPGAIKGAADPLAASVAFVAGLDDTGHGPGRVHYPVPAPGGVRNVWAIGVQGCRRALHDGRVPAAARFVVADALEGRAVGWGATREEALAACRAEIAREMPEQRTTLQTAADDYDDDGNLIGRGELPDFLRLGGAGGAEAAPGETPAEAPEGEPPASEMPEPEVDPITGQINFGLMAIRGPVSDVPPVPKRAECVPLVLVPLDPSPAGAPAQGRWVRLLGQDGTTCHAVRSKDGDGFLLVGADLLGHLDWRTLREDLDRLDAEQEVHQAAFASPFPEYERYVRFRASQYRWQAERPASADHPARPAGLAYAGGSSGPRFDAGGLDGDLLQSHVHRQHRVRRPVD